MEHAGGRATFSAYRGGNTHSTPSTHLKPTSTDRRQRSYQAGAQQGMRKSPRQTMMDSTRWKRSLPGRLLQASSDASWVTPCSARHALQGAAGRERCTGLVGYIGIVRDKRQQL